MFVELVSELIETEKTAGCSPDRRGWGRGGGGGGHMPGVINVTQGEVRVGVFVYRAGGGGGERKIDRETERKRERERGGWGVAAKGYDRTRGRTGEVDVT